MTVRRNRRAGIRAIAVCLAAAGSALLAAGCGGRTLAVGSIPFPSEKPVFLDPDGRPLRNLPDAPEPAKLVVLDFPWCPPCAEAWKSIRAAAGALPPGTVRVDRILFDRERIFSREGVVDVPPLHPVQPGGPGVPGLEVTTLTALPGAFRKEFEFGQAPVILLLSPDGKVLRRWTGQSPSLSASLVAEITRLKDRAQGSSDSPPP